MLPQIPSADRHHPPPRAAEASSAPGGSPTCSKTIRVIYGDDGALLEGSGAARPWGPHAEAANLHGPGARACHPNRALNHVFMQVCSP